MGRPRKVLEFNKKHFTKEEIATRQATEKAYKVRRDQLTPPEKLSPRAKEEFERVKEMAFWLDNLDRNELILHSFYWDRVLSIIEEYDETPEVIEETSSDGTSRLTGNPLRKALREYHAELRAISLKLGLSSIDRLKLSAPQEEKPVNKFFEFIK